MNIFKKLWNFLFGKQEEPVVEAAAEKESVDHCGSHLRFKKSCPDCLRVVALI
jgi:hypothetical protein